MQTGLFSRIFTVLNPKQILTALSAIDHDAKAERAQLNDDIERKRVWLVIMVACVCLLMVNYLKYSSVLLESIRMLEGWFDIKNQQWSREFRGHPYRELIGYVWWGFWNVLCFLIIPMLTIKLVLKQKLNSYGWQLGSIKQHWLGYVLLASPIMFFAFLVSFREDFANHYPFYNLAHKSWLDLILWECIYILQFIAVEFFFRGFLVNGLRIPFGSLSIAVMCLPYLMLHFPKLWLESFGAISFGFLLGILALRSKSIWGGVAVHVAIALTMDFMAMMQTKGFPEQFMR
ncbi:MAG: membrane protease YdiL (CAAX protease family) [Oleispira sp.]|jgi:membrane protease YdiL (CAAX protease family)